MRNMLSDELGNYFDNYDIVFVDVPYIDNNNYKNRELEIKMTQYRYDCEDIIFRVTNKNYEEKQIYYSMGLLCLSSYLKKHIKEIKIGYVHYYLNYDEFDTFIGKTKVVAFSTMTVTMQLINILIKKAKDINPNITVILGGYHVSFYAKETLQNNPFVDFVILKEGEQALLALFEKRDIDYIEGIAYRNQDGDIRINEFVHYLNPEEIPSPDYSLIDKYLDKMNIQLSTMRGCIGRCNFCVNHNYWKFPRLREIHNIVEELQYLKSVLPRGTIIHIIDNIFTLNEIHLKNILVITRHIASEMISLFLHVTNLFVLCMMIMIILHIFTITCKPSIGLSAFHIRIFYLTMRISPLYVKKISYAMMTLIYTIIFRLLIKTSLLLMKIFWPIITIFRSYARIC